MERVISWLGIMVVAALIGAIIAAAAGLPLMWLWNWLMPSIFGLPTIGFWQAVGLNLLTTILFRSVGSSKND